MLITKDFLILNYPKTGSTFVRTVLKKIHWERKSKNLLIRALKKFNLLEKDIQEIFLPNLFMPNRPLNPHGGYSQIPKKFFNREVVSVVRNPYERFLSGYEYKHWQKFPPIEKEKIQKLFPHFPNLSFDEYVDLNVEIEKEKMNRFNISNSTEIGSQTIQFVKLFFKKPFDTLAKLNDNYIYSKEYQKDMGKIHFLSKENLVEDLVAFLKKHNYSEAELDMIKSHKKVNVTKSKTSNKESLWTQKTIDYVEKKDRYLLQILKDFGFDYIRPKLQTEINSF